MLLTSFPTSNCIFFRTRENIMSPDESILLQVGVFFRHVEKPDTLTFDP